MQRLIIGFICIFPCALSGSGMAGSTHDQVQGSQAENGLKPISAELCYDIVVIDSLESRVKRDQAGDDNHGKSDKEGC